MKDAAGSGGRPTTTKPVTESASPPAESDGLAQRRLFYAERCDNLIQALQFVGAVLRKTPAGGNDTRDARARCLSERLPPEALEEEFQRINAMWATWTRPKTGRIRTPESVEHHARMALLAAVDQATQFIHLSKVARALARWRAGRALDQEDEGLVANSADATAAAGLLDGKAHTWPTYGDVPFERDEAITGEAVADADLPQPGPLVRFLTREHGHPDVAARLTDEQPARLVEAWPKQAGRPRRGQVAPWDVISRILVDLHLGGSANVRKDWEAFRRAHHIAKPLKSPKPRRPSGRKRKGN